MLSEATILIFLSAIGIALTGAITKLWLSTEISQKDVKLALAACEEDRDKLEKKIDGLQIKIDVLNLTILEALKEKWAKNAADIAEAVVRTATLETKVEEIKGK